MGFRCVNWSEVNIKLYLPKSKAGSNKHENAKSMIKIIL